MQKSTKLAWLCCTEAVFIWLETKQYPNNTLASSAGTSPSRHGHSPKIPCLLLWR